MKLAPESAAAVSETRSKIGSKDGSSAMDSCSISKQSENQPERGVVQFEPLTTPPLGSNATDKSSAAPAIKAQSPVYSIALLKTLSSTLTYLKQYEERCNIQS